MQERYGISDATARNWEKLNTRPDGRLTARANKRKSKKRILPVEYMSSKQNVAFIQGMLDYVDENRIDIMSVMLSLGVCLLKKAGLYEKKHVAAVLREYSGIDVVSDLISLEMPEDEYDLLGLLYQSYLQEGKKNRIGSYYTPKKIVWNMVKDFDLAGGKSFFDPCCGSGAFLLAVPAEHPDQIFGVDNDRTAVLIAKINMLLRYPDFAFIPQVYCLDYLTGSSAARRHPVFGKNFDYIATNPPWGAMDHNYSDIPEITSKETFAYFFVKAYGQLAGGGIIRFLFPQSILNVKAHKDIRRYFLETAGIVSITAYEDLFSGVTTKYIDIKCENAAGKKQFMFYSDRGNRMIDAGTVYETENLVFHLLSEEDLSIIRSVKNKGKYSLKDSVWALGIVTGDNKGKLFSECLEDMEKIYTGKEIQPFYLKPAKKFILYDRDNLQQAAKDEIYRASEKLVYKFISNKLVFAYDDSASLFLNSANILIPAIPSMSMKSVLAFLNSTLFQFLYQKMFGEVKILKGNLIELPFPELSAEENENLTELVDEVLGGDTSKQEVIENEIFLIYGLTEEQAAYVRRIVNGLIT